MQNRKPILTLDFDGVVHSYTSKYQGPEYAFDPPTPGAKEAIATYISHFHVHIFSSRSHQMGGRPCMYDYCRDHFGYDIAQKLEFPQHKPPSMLCLDDRALTFTGIWPDLGSLKAFRPWNKK